MRAAPHTLCHVALAETECARGLSGRRIAGSPIPRCSWGQPDPQGRTEGHSPCDPPSCQVTADPARRLRGRRIRGVRGNRSDVVREPGRTRAGSSPTFRSASASVTATSASSLTVGRPANVATGDVLLAAISARLSATSSISAPSGWALVRRDNCTHFGQSLAQAVFVKAASMSEPASYAFTFSAATGASASVLDYDGANATQPVDASSGGYTQSSQSTIAPGHGLAGEYDSRRPVLPHNGTAEFGTPSGMTRRTGLLTATPSVIAATADQPLALRSPTGNRSVIAALPSPCSIGQQVVLRRKDWCRRHRRRHRRRRRHRHHHRRRRHRHRRRRRRRPGTARWRTRRGACRGRRCPSPTSTGSARRRCRATGSCR